VYPEAYQGYARCACVIAFMVRYLTMNGLRPNVHPEVSKGERDFCVFNRKES